MDIVINEVTYSLPCREFMIDYSVSQRRQLPVVKEFVVRFMFIVGSCEPVEIRNYFGFTDSELDIVLLDLQEERLIKWSEDEICLTSYALERFEEVDGKAMPRFFEISDQLDKVKFDMMSYKLITQRFEGQQRPNNIEISISEDAFLNTTSKVEAAFNQSFSTYLEKVKGVDVFSEQKELYKINQVYAKNEFMLPIKVQYFIDSDHHDHPLLEFADDWVQDWDEDNAVMAAINKSLTEQRRATPPQLRAIQSYLDVTQDPVIDSFLSDVEVDVASFLSTYNLKNTAYSTKGRMLVGNLYTEENQRVIHELLDGEVGEEEFLPARGAIWSVCVDGKMWGRCPDLEVFAESIKSRLDPRRSLGSVALCLHVDTKRQANELSNLYRSPSISLLGVSSPFGNTQTEVLLIPDVLVACLFHHYDDNFGNLTVPLGYVTTDGAQIDAVHRKLIEWSKSTNSLNDLFERRNGQSESTVRSRFIDNFLLRDHGLR